MDCHLDLGLLKIRLTKVYYPGVHESHETQPWTWEFRKVEDGKLFHADLCSLKSLPEERQESVSQVERGLEEDLQGL